MTKQKVTKNMFPEAYILQKCDYCVEFELLWFKRIYFLLKSESSQTVPKNVQEISQCFCFTSRSQMLHYKNVQKISQCFCFTSRSLIG